MKNLSFKRVATIGGLVGLSLLPGRAVLSQSTASFSGVVSYNANGVVTSISAQITLPPNVIFSGNSTVTPTFVNNRPTALTLTPNSVIPSPVLSPGAQVAIDLSRITNLTTNEVNLATYISIVRAAAGAGGLD